MAATRVLVPAKFYGWSFTNIYASSNTLRSQDYIDTLHDCQFVLQNPTEYLNTAEIDSTFRTITMCVHSSLTQKKRVVFCCGLWAHAFKNAHNQANLHIS